MSMSLDEIFEKLSNEENPNEELRITLCELNSVPKWMTENWKEDGWSSRTACCFYKAICRNQRNKTLAHILIRQRDSWRRGID